jgi:group I intron endonuclease
MSIKSGIYTIINKITKKEYIGSSKNIKRRFNKHKSDLKNKKHHSYLFQRAWNKYGEENFELIIIEPVENCQLLIEREKYYLQTRKPKYNIDLVPNTGFLNKKHSNETKEKISKKNKNKYLAEKNPMWGVKGCNHPRFGVPPVNKGKKGLQSGKKGVDNPNYGKPALNRRKIIQKDINNNIIKEWESIKLASDALKIDKGHITNCCKKKVKTAKGFIFEYKENTN